MTMKNTARNTTEKNERTSGRIDVRRIAFWLAALAAAALVAFSPAAVKTVGAATLQSAGTELRTGMKNRESSVTVTAPAGTSADAVYNEAIKFTGAGNEGDYLRWVIVGSSSTSMTSGGVARITYSLSYSDTAAQEREVTKALSREEAYYIGTPYQKIQSAYYYTVTHSGYASGSDADQYFTAYGHLKGKAYCEGYALTLYRLLNDKGIPCRIITGNSTNMSGGTEEHAWNAVQMDGKWYYLDATWDSCLKNTKLSKYEYFMRGKNKMPGHTPTDGDGYSASLVNSLKFSSDNYIKDKTYTVKVTGGSGSGTYTAGSIVTIKADTGDGIKFKKWIGTWTGVSGGPTSSTIKIKVTGNVSLKASTTEKLATVKNGNYKIQNAGASKVLNVKGNSTKKNALIVGANKKKAGSAVFKVSKTGKYYYFTNTKSKMYLDLKGSKVVQGAKNSTSKWKLLKINSKTYKLKNQNGKVVTLNGTKVTGKANQTGTKTQKFKLTK